MTPENSVRRSDGDPLETSAIWIVIDFPTQPAIEKTVPAGGRIVRSATRAAPSSASMRTDDARGLVDAVDRHDRRPDAGPGAAAGGGRIGFVGHRGYTCSAISSQRYVACAWSPELVGRLIQAVICGK